MPTPIDGIPVTPPLDARAALAARLFDEPVAAECAHIAVALIALALLRQAADAVPLFGWLALVSGTAIARALVRRAIARQGVRPDRVPPLLRASIVATGLSWGAGAFYFASRLPLGGTAVVMVVLCGLAAAATSTLLGDPPSYYGFTAALIVPLAGGLLIDPSAPGHLGFVFLTLLFGGVTTLTYRRAHTILREAVASAHVLAGSRLSVLGERRFLDKLVASVPIAVAVLNRDDTVQRVNPVFESMFGFPSSEVVGRRIDDAIVPPEGLATARWLKERTGQEGGVSHEAERRRKDGRKVFVRIAAARVDADSGATLVLYDDMTDRRAREQRTAAQTTVVHALGEATSDQDAIPVVLVAVGHHLGWHAASYWRVDSAADSARCTFTWAEDRVTRNELATTLPGADVTRGDGIIGQAWATHSEIWVEELGGHPSELPAAIGTLRTKGSAVAVPVDRGGETVGVLVFLSGQTQPRDASELEAISIIATQLGNAMDRFRVEGALREAETRYRQLVEAAADVVWRVDLEGRFTFVNGASRHVWGFPPDALVGQRFSMLAHPNVVDPMEIGFAHLFEGDELRNYETVTRTPSGGAVHTSVSASPLRDRDGTIVGAQGIARDIGNEVAMRVANEAARVAAEEAAMAKSAFLANMSHEIRTPMTGILGLAELMLTSELPPDQRRSVELIAASGETLLHIINDILELSKIEAHQLELEVAPFELASAIQPTAALLAPTAKARGVSVRVEIDPRLPRNVRGDCTRLGQILTNLLGNAIKFTPNGSIVVSISPIGDPPGDQVRFSVRDTGVGIGPDAIARIFEPFRQADTSTTRLYGGTGLGLSIARRLVDLMGGVLEVDSEVGVGSDFHFTVRLPASTAPRVSTRRTDPTGQRLVPADLDPPTRALRILIAEDNPVNQEVAATMLRRRGHQVDTANNGREAVDAVRDTVYDVVLMDIQMPLLDGIQATLEIRSRETTTPLSIIALTANALAGERERCLDAGMNDYLSKPFRPLDLIATVEGTIDEAHERLARRSTPTSAFAFPVDVEGLRAELVSSGVGDALDTILQLFATDAPKRLAAIEHAVTTVDAHSIVRAAHAFKSSAGTIRARELARCLQALEDAARGGRETDVTRVVVTVREHYRAVMEQLGDRRPTAS